MNCSDHDAAALARGSGLTHGTSDNRASEKSPAEVQKNGGKDQDRTGDTRIFRAGILRQL